MAIQSATLHGLERKLVFSRLRAAIGLRWELPRLLEGVELPPEGRCLEIGAGYGWGTLGLLQRSETLRAVASDYDRAVLPATRAYLARQGVRTRVTFCQADATSLPFADGAFDLVLALYVLHHIAGRRAALREIGRVTRPGGRFLFIDVVVPRWMSRIRGPFAPEGVANREELSQSLAAAGFRVERWQWRPALWLLPTAWVVAGKEGA